MLLVPRRIVRALPWINYDDFLRLEFAAYLGPNRRPDRPRRLSQRKRKSKDQPEKPEVVEISRRDFDRVLRFVASKEAASSEAQPSTTYLADQEACPETNELARRLLALPTGQKDAADYQRLVLEILNTCFSPELIDGRLEVKTVDGTERRDIIFMNDSDKTFWTYLRQEHSSFLVMFETKNKAELIPSDFNQTATYLGDRLGRFGVIVGRAPLTDAGEKKAFSIYNDSQPRKVILCLSDNDLVRMLQLVCEGRDPMAYLRDKYRGFRERVQ